VSTLETAGQSPPVEATAWEIRVLYDGGCPLCMGEIRALRRLDRERGRISFEDIAAPGFDPALYGLSYETLMSRIHGVLPDGTLLEGVEVFRRLYSAVGLGWLVAPTRWPGLRGLFDAAYRAFARNRLWLTGREQAACTPERCSIPSEGKSSAV
jgi:predicted DCC family thiol-disulfide oxidoreductase YuxK